MFTSSHVRQLFFEYFKAQGHTQVPSSPLIPAQDPTLLFANAGMNQFKDVFTGQEKRSYRRAVSIQKCIRAGGKHNDLEQVGFTARHLTFFEMMGNFSFGDYFKKEAITYAWGFLTESLGLPKDTLWASVHEHDDESYHLWHDITGLPYSRIVKLGDADNFWSMGDVGPCGPCTEIYVDRGAGIGCGASTCAPGCSCDRFLEIWNLVFMQYERRADGSRRELTQTGVDTGMGLERLCMVLAHAPSVYETDVFKPLLDTIARHTGIDYQTASDDQRGAFRVLADHARSVTLAISDGGVPAADGRGYVLRKIIRRAALFADKLSDNGIELFVRVCDEVIAHMGTVYPDILTVHASTLSTIRGELEKFWHQLGQGRTVLRTALTTISGTVIPGDLAFKLYDTYGFPLELTNVLAHQQGYTVDRDGFERALEAQRAQSGKKTKKIDDIQVPSDWSTEFVGYEQTRTTGPIIGLLVDGCVVDRVAAGQVCTVVTAQSPLYIECGGQIDDTAVLIVGGQVMSVTDIVKHGAVLGAVVTPSVDLAVGQEVTIQVDEAVRAATMKNHTATHLLQAALQKIIGQEVRQAGSYVGPDYLRFDITISRALTQSELDRIERAVNETIWRDVPVDISYSTYQDATKAGVIAFFGDKYNPERVRVVRIAGPDTVLTSAELISAELCGGTHVPRTGVIGLCKIIQQEALSAGVRRLVAVTGPGALAWCQQVHSQVRQIATDLKVGQEHVSTAVQNLLEQNKHLSQAQRKLVKDSALVAIDRAQQQARTLSGGVRVVSASVPQLAAGDLKEFAERVLKQGYGLVMLSGAPTDQAQVPFLIQQGSNVSYDLTGIKNFARQQGIKGGGNPLSFQGSATAEQLALLEQQLQ